MLIITVYTLYVAATGLGVVLALEDPMNAHISIFCLMFNPLYTYVLLDPAKPSLEFFI